MIRALCFAMALLAANVAQATTTNLSIIINSPPSTAVTCTVNYPSGQTVFITPVAIGRQVISCVVDPSTWSGALTLSGPDASFFAMSGTNVVVGAAAITAARNYNVTITSTP